MHPCCWAEMCSHVVFHSWISEDCLLLLNHQFPASRMLFPAFLKKKNSWNIWGNCNIAGLKKAWNCQYLKSCTGRVYLFFCWSLHLSYFHVCYWPSNQCRRSNIYKVTAEDQLSTGQTKRVVTESVGCNSLFLNCFEMVFLAHHILSLNYRSAVLWNDVVELVLAIFYKLSFKKKNLLHVSYTVLIDQDI